MRERVEAQAKLLAKLGQEEIENNAYRSSCGGGQEMGRSFLLLVDNRVGFLTRSKTRSSGGSAIYSRFGAI